MNPAPAATAIPGALRAARALAAVLLLALAYSPAYAFARSWSDPCLPVDKELVFPALVAMAPFVLFLIRARPSPIGRLEGAKSALPWAILWSLLLTAPAIYLVAATRQLADITGIPLTRSEIYYALLAAAAMAFAACGIIATRSLRDVAAGPVVWLSGIGIAAVWAAVTFGVWSATFTPVLSRPLPVNQAAAVGSLRNLSIAQVHFQNAHPEKGYARSLAELGPAPGAGLLDPVIAAGERFGYRITLLPGPPDQNGRTTAYSAVARPVQYKITGCYCFFVDESAVVRRTYEDRPATSADSPLN
ncbi:MAG TPA: hypothetical protein VMI93_16565 [Candidatus Solibacter sp.]|nr:hypothetical protein [Candidatus Solibacter sp.]